MSPVAEKYFSLLPQRIQAKIVYRFVVCELRGNTYGYPEPYYISQWKRDDAKKLFLLYPDYATVPLMKQLATLYLSTTKEKEDEYYDR